MKICTKCNSAKEDNEYYKQRGKLYSSCKSCKKKQVNKNYVHHPRQLKKDKTIVKQCCSTCEVIKPISDYSFRRKRGIYLTNCKACQRIKQVVKTYNVSAEKAISLMNNHTCGICKSDVYGQNQHVDHDHSTGKARDILCNNCNRAIGYFQEDIDILNNAIKYINKHND